MRLQTIIYIIMSVMSLSSYAQYTGQTNVDGEKYHNLTQDLVYRVETQGSFSSGKTPLWLNANKYGLSSLRKNNGYLRGSICRPLSKDSDRHWGIGYGIDLVAPLNYTSKFVVQQAYGEMRWHHGVLTIGSKEYPMELKNNSLSSGSQTLGINARPIPQVRIALPEYWTLPIGGRWLHMKGHIAYGWQTDERWQHDFTSCNHKYADDVKFHSKAGYLKIGNKEKIKHWNLELGLEMATLYGGTAYGEPDASGNVRIWQGETGLKGMWHSFIPGGGDQGEGLYENMAGDDLGSWVARLNYDTDKWAAHLYIDHFFEDQSMMFLFDYDGYGTGENWNKREKLRLLHYPMKDMLLGTEINLKQGRWLRDIVFEYIYTRYQSGPVYHDRTETISDHVAGKDNYYNHYIYPGWQHWGQVMGNPLYRSPLYNTDGMLMVENNRFWGFHLGLSGHPVQPFDYRILATWQEGFGTYDYAFDKIRHNASVMFEGVFHLHRNWDVKGAYAMDFGSILGRNTGFQITVTKIGVLGL